MQKQAIRIISSFKNMGQASIPEQPIIHEYIGELKGWKGALRFIWKCFQSDLVILNIDQERLMLACALRWLLPMLRLRLISVDLILRPPKTLKRRLTAFIKRILFSRVDQFIFYFKNTEGYQRFYGIAADRIAYVPFKVNGWEQASLWSHHSSDGDYVLCAGRTLRDVQTFVEAVKRVGCPGMLLQQKRELLAEHGTTAWSGELPSNINLMIDDGDQIESYINFLSHARIVVIPRFRGDIAATGISTYLMAMALNKCVIISEGPGAEDILTDQAAIVPPENPELLAQQIELLWNNHELRSEIASRGREYAQFLAGEKRIFTDILRISMRSLQNHR